jgi:hypothetical protein
MHYWFEERIDIGELREMPEMVQPVEKKGNAVGLSLRSFVGREIG